MSLGALAQGVGTEAVGERVTECRWASKAPILDGRLDEEEWKGAQVVEGFQARWLDKDKRQPPTKTKARLLWDREYLYFAAEMEDVDVFAAETMDDGSVWLNDVFELFLKPSAQHPGYYEFEVNAANAKLDMFVPSRGAGGFYRFGKERPFHIESVVRVDGTLNDWSDKDRGWTVEGRIPWTDFLPTGGAPALGEVWLHALCRYDYSVGLEAPALSSTAPLEQPNFHRYENYVPLKFVGPGGVARAAEGWKPGAMQGTPEPPPPFVTENAFPRLKTRFPIALVLEPGKTGWLLVENDGYVPDRASRIRRVESFHTEEPETVLTLEESVYDLCFHPDFKRNGWVYLGANGRFGPGKEDFNNRLLRYRMDPATGRLDPGSRTVFLEWKSYGHNGMALDFGRDGMLYVTSGDGSNDGDEWETAQDLSRLYSKVLRLDVDRPAADAPYSIPKDNPFLNTPGARPETWAYGFRNPWRLHVDRRTGDLWVGENGQDLWEYARIARAGENYGWPLKEGNHDFQPSRKAGPTPISPALIEHSHKDFRSLTGGMVYYGKKHSELQGAYIYGDYSTGQVWAAWQKDRVLQKDRLLAYSRLNLVHFSESPGGDVLLIDHNGHAIHRLVPRAPAQVPTGLKFPERLSQTNLFLDVRVQKPAPGVVPYEVNASGWHDGAVSERWLAVPEGKGMEVTAKRAWNLPEGSAVVQTLSREGRRIETRILLKSNQEWTGYSYAWNGEQTDAHLLGAEGRTTEQWVYPSRQECSVCHSRQAGFLLGLSTLQLNRKNAAGQSQLALWEAEGRLFVNHAASGEWAWKKEFLEGGVPENELSRKLATVRHSALQRPLPERGAVLGKAPEQLPALPDPADLTAQLEDRARAYLHVNCAHCHVRAGGGNAAIQLGFDVPAGDRGLFGAPVHSSLGLADARLVAPGDPSRSVLLLRTAMRGQGQMPPLGTLRVDPSGTALLVEWISRMQATAVKEPGTSPK